MYKLSVVVPVYNVEGYVSACIESLCKQWCPEIEIILVDDGSTDRSGIICDEYASRFEYISAIHQENRGLGGARNTGTLAAKGDYIAWIDSDDLVDSLWAESILKVINTYTPDVIVYDYLMFGNGTQRKMYYGRKEGLLDISILIDDVMRDIRMQAYAWQKVFKRKICLKELYVEDRQPLEDYEIMYRLLQHCTSAYYIKTVLYWYRQREGSLIRGHNFEQSWHSYQLSIKREDEVAQIFQQAALVARCIQGYRLCIFERWHLRSEDNLVDHNRCRLARKHIRHNLYSLLTSHEVPRGWKIRFLLAAFYLDIFIKKH